MWTETSKAENDIRMQSEMRATGGSGVELKIEPFAWAPDDKTDWALAKVTHMQPKSGDLIPLPAVAMERYFVNIARLPSDFGTTSTTNVIIDKIISDETVNEVVVMTGRGLLRGKIISGAPHPIRRYFKIEGPGIRKLNTNFIKNHSLTIHLQRQETRGPLSSTSGRRNSAVSLWLRTSPLRSVCLN